MWQHSNCVNSVALSPDGKFALAALEDGTARIWEVATGTESAVMRGHEGEVIKAVFSPDAERVLTASIDETARLWDARTGAETICIALDAGVTAAAYGNDILALGDQLGRLHVYDLDDATLVRERLP